VSRSIQENLPVMRLHRPSGRARLRLCGYEIWLGPWKSDEAKARYDEVLRQYLEAGRRWPPITAGVRTVAELCDRYADFADAHYVKRGKRTRTASNARRALELLQRVPAPSDEGGRPELRGLGAVEPLAFGPRCLKAYQRYLAGDTQGPRGTSQWSRDTINEYVRHVVAMFRWAVSEELVPSEILVSLKAVAPLARGRAPAAGVAPPRDGRPVDPVPDRDLALTLPRLGTMLRAMVDVQLVTAMRPGEVCYMRAGDLAPTVVKGVVCYHVPPEANKTEHLEIDRKVYIGPKGMEILRPWLPEDPDEFVFGPRKAEALRHAEARKARKAKVWPSHTTEARRARRGHRPMKMGDHYSEDAYRRAIARACEAAGVPTWSPNRLRHNAATVITERESIEVAQLILGHRDIKTTLRYAKVKDRRAMVAALRHG
jgi:integrase